MRHYMVRRATLADVDVLVRHRTQMFQDMGVMPTPDPDEPRIAAAYRAWLEEQMPDGRYVGWVVDEEGASGEKAVVAGGGATIIPWPPGPRTRSGRMAFIYNVYTEADHRGRGLARRIMDAIHAFCRDEGIDAVALNASTFGRPLYESIGYTVSESPMMFLSLD